jgi:hypothetical protein
MRAGLAFAARNDDPRSPARGPATVGKRDRLDVEAGACEQPGDPRVRVPHLTCTELVATPDWRGNALSELKQTSRTFRVVAQPDRALDRSAMSGMTPSRRAPPQSSSPRASPGPRRADDPPSASRGERRLAERHPFGEQREQRAFLARQTPRRPHPALGQARRARGGRATRARGLRAQPWLGQTGQGRHPRCRRLNRTLHGTAHGCARASYGSRAHPRDAHKVAPSWRLEIGC